VKREKKRKMKAAIAVFIVCLAYLALAQDTNINFNFAGLLSGVNIGGSNGSNGYNQTREELLKSKVQFIYNHTIYPLNVGVLTGQTSIKDIFDSNVQGRFDPIGSFEGITEVSEYFFAIGATPSPRGISVVYDYLFASKNQVFVKVNVLVASAQPYNESYDPATQTYDYDYEDPLYFNFTQQGVYTFNDKDLIQATDLISRPFGRVLDPQTPKRRESVINRLCYNLVVNPAKCNSTTDPQGYYSSFADCVQFMKSIDYGSWDLVASNSVTCRLFHSILTVTDPVLHCPHTGRTGGGKCIDYPYESYYQGNLQI